MYENVKKMDIGNLIIVALKSSLYLYGFYYLFVVFPILVNYYFHVFFDLKVILPPGQKKYQNSVTKHREL